jgi:hypothetical protein
MRIPQPSDVEPESDDGADEINCRAAQLLCRAACSRTVNCTLVQCFVIPTENRKKKSVFLVSRLCAVSSATACLGRRRPVGPQSLAPVVTPAAVRLGVGFCLLTLVRHPPVTGFPSAHWRFPVVFRLGLVTGGAEFRSQLCGHCVIASGCPNTASTRQSRSS